ncbi:meiotic nuclear division protein 1 homolog [Humulus lupulus]|uniref:meiotic nuclear division protein 1 homolog n=1 Tax=Humulus lupulus TaxID=3486 RepID=UPI002B40B46A|nr:meiotic nuclear division protein 1 homolog [Humulus lupulus]
MVPRIFVVFSNGSGEKSILKIRSTRLVGIRKQIATIALYFWSLPSCAGNQLNLLRNVTRKLESDLHSSKKRFAELAEQCESLKKEREASDEREEALNELKSIQQKHTEVKEEMKQYADNDPAAFEAMRSAIEVAHSAANRWTEAQITELVLFRDALNLFPLVDGQLYHENSV